MVEPAQNRLATRVVGALVAAGLLAGSDSVRAVAVVETALTMPTEGQAPPTSRVKLAEVGGYVGAALVLAAIALLVAQQWENLSPAARIATLAGIAAALALVTVVMAVVVGPRQRLRTEEGARRHLVAVLSFLTAIAAAGATGTWADQSLGSADPGNAPLRLALWVAVFVLLAAYWLAAHGIVQAALGFAVFLLISSSFPDTQPWWYVQQSGTALTAGAVWLVVAEAGGWRERTLGRLLGGAFLVFAAQSLAFDGRHATPPWWAYVATFVVAVAMLAAYLWRDDWAYLVVGVVALTVAVTQTLLDVTKGSLGAGGAVLVAGLTLLATSGVALWLRRTRVAAADD